MQPPTPLIDAATGGWIALFDHDDLLVDVALEIMMLAARNTGARMLYSDEDKIDEFGNLLRTTPENRLELPSVADEQLRVPPSSRRSGTLCGPLGR